MKVSPWRSCSTMSDHATQHPASIINHQHRRRPRRRRHRPGMKASQQQAEENHSLMAVNMLQQMLVGTGRSWTEDSLKGFLQRMNDQLSSNSPARVTSSKLRACVNVIIHTPPVVRAGWVKHYLKYTWERSLMTEALLADRIWRLGYKLREARGHWGEVYTTTKEVLTALQNRLIAAWEGMYPKSMVRGVNIPDLQQSRPSRSVPDDPEMRDLTIAQQYCLYMCFFFGWVRPKAMEGYGAVGGEAIDKAFQEWQPWFLSELKYGVLKRDQSATYDVLRLSDMPGIDALLKKTALGVSMEAEVAQARTLGDEWGKFEKQYKADLEVFNKCTEAKVEQVRAQRLHELADFKRLTIKGENMVETHGKFYFRVTLSDDSLSRGAADIFEFVDIVRLAEAAPGTSTDDMPVLLFWDLNSLPNTGRFESHWQGHAQCVASVLEARANSSAAVIVCRKAVPTMSRRRFHDLITAFLEKRGVDCDTDLAFSYKHDVSPGTSLVLSAMICFSQKSDVKRNPWSSTALARGAINDIAAPRERDMMPPFDIDNLAFEALEARNMSCTQRSNFITTRETDSNNLYTKVLEAAFGRFDSTAKSKTDKPLAVFCCIDPLDATLPLAVQQYMAAAHQQPTGCDMRAIAITAVPNRFKLVLGAVEAEVFKQWYQRKYSIPGHPFQSRVPFVGAEISAPELTVARLDGEGRFRLQTEPLRAFFECDAVAAKAKALWDEVEMNANKPDAPKWQPLAPNQEVAESSLANADPPPTRALEHTYPSLEKLLEAVQPLADIPNSNATFRLVVTPTGEGWATCVKATSVGPGEIFVSAGSGSRMDAEASQRKMPAHVGFLCKLPSDGALVAYRKDTVTQSTFYNLHAQVMLEGNPKVELSYHEIRPKAGEAGLERFDLELKRERYWVCAKPRTDASSIRWDNILRLVGATGIPNNLVQLVWELKKEMQGGIACLTFERPYLGFTRAMTFQEGDWFRWA